MSPRSAATARRRSRPSGSTAPPGRRRVPGSEATSSETVSAPTYWTSCTVQECEPGRSFTFGVGPPGKALSIWGYRMEALGDGTDVTETFHLADTGLLRLYWALLGWARGRTNRNDMRTTLERIKAGVEGGTDVDPGAAAALT